MVLALGVALLSQRRLVTLCVVAGKARLILVRNQHYFWLYPQTRPERGLWLNFGDTKYTFNAFGAFCESIHGFARLYIYLSTFTSFLFLSGEIFMFAEVEISTICSFGVPR